MGFFGKLFEKKECAICGGEIGLLGNRKLEDGNMCKKCAAKLSPWFSDRRNSTVAEIEQQLEYRAQNQEALKNFHPSRRVGKNYKLIAEEKNGVPHRFVVSDSQDFVEEDADLILFSDVSSCNIDIQEDRDEIMRTNDKGESVSYNPPRYRYSYNFYVNFGIENNPYFDEINFRLNNFSVDIEHQENDTGVLGLLFGSQGFDPEADSEYRQYKKMCDEIEEMVEDSRSGGAQIEDVPVQKATGAKFCSNCGAPVSGGKFCEHCGSRL